MQQAGITNPALLPILQNLSSAVNSAGHSDITQQLAAAMMLPNHLTAQQQLQSALLNAGQSPLIACNLILLHQCLPVKVLIHLILL